MLSKIRLIFISTVTAISVSLLGFVIHVLTEEKLKLWISNEMQNTIMKQSWDVRLLAGLTSVEIGTGIVVLYSVLRHTYPKKCSLYRGLILAILLLICQGLLIRQPLMDIAIGNPFYISLVQNGAVWLLWLIMCCSAALLFDGLCKWLKQTKYSRNTAKTS